MKNRLNTAAGFTLVELLIAIAVIGILIALIFPALHKAGAAARRTACLNNLRQITLAVRMYADDSRDLTPWIGPSTNRVLVYAYKELVQEYAGLNSQSSPSNKLFACPSDTFCYHMSRDVPQWYVPQPRHSFPAADYSSYSFNGANQFTNAIPFGTGPLPGIGGLRLTQIKHPARTAMMLEAPAFLFLA